MLECLGERFHFRAVALNLVNGYQDARPMGSFRIFRKLLQLSQVFAFFANWAETVPLGASACSRLPSSFSVPLRWHPPPS